MEESDGVKESFRNCCLENLGLRMEGEDMRAGTRKKRSKKEIGFDSDDDEPIGSIFKLKRAKRKGSGSGEAVREKEDLGGMDDNDTLASFRKRLKGPKRDQGSGVARGASSGVHVSDEDLVGLGAKGKDEKGVALVPGGEDMQMQDSSDQHMEDSLSAIFHKAQSSSARKSRGGSRQKRGIQKVDSGLSPGGVVEAVDSVVESRSGSASGSKLVGGNAMSDDALPQASEPVVTSVVEDQKCVNDCFQEEIAKGECGLDIPDGLDQSNDVYHEDEKQFSCALKAEDISCDSDQKVALQESVVISGLHKLSSMPVDEIVETASLSKVGEGERQVTEVGEVENRLTDELVEACYSASERDVSTSAGKENVLTSWHTEALIKSTESVLSENNDMVSGKGFQESSRNGALKLSGCHMDVDGGGKSDTEFVSDRNLCDYSNLDTKAEVQDFVVGISPKRNDVTVSGSSMVSNEAELDARSNHPEKSVEACNIPKDPTVSILKCSSVLDPILSDGSSPQSSIPDENGNSAEYHTSVSDFVDNDGKISGIPRVVRKTKMRKHGDMTYEGDADWEVLINDQALNESQVMTDVDRTLRTRMSSLNMGDDSENVAVAAVSAGLKARKAGPIEKIKFKEILKRKGGLKEYLDCR